MCHSAARGRPRALPQLSPRPIEQGGQYTHHSAGFDSWLVLDDVDGGYRVRVRVSFSSYSNRAFNKSKGVVWGWSFRCTTMGRFSGKSPT